LGLTAEQKILFSQALDITKKWESRQKLERVIRPIEKRDWPSIPRINYKGLARGGLGSKEGGL